MSAHQRKSPFLHPVDQLRTLPGPAGVRCPHCRSNREIFVSGRQINEPLVKRLLYCWLRCQCCGTRFCRIRVGPAVLWGAAALLLLLAGISY